MLCSSGVRGFVSFAPPAPAVPHLCCQLCTGWACSCITSLHHLARASHIFAACIFHKVMYLGSKAGAKHMVEALNREQGMGSVGFPLSSGNKFLCQLTASWKCTRRHLIGAVISFSLLLSKAVFC